MCECDRGSLKPAACITPAGKRHPTRPQRGWETERKHFLRIWRALHGLQWHSLLPYHYSQTEQKPYEEYLLPGRSGQGKKMY